MYIYMFEPEYIYMNRMFQHINSIYTNFFIFVFILFISFFHTIKYYFALCKI